VSEYALVEPGSVYRLPTNFDFQDYIETERELWALFPETDGKRVNFFQIGITARLFVEVADDGSDLLENETYVFMPCDDNTMRPIRMEAGRRLTLTEYRMAHLTAIRMLGKLNSAGTVMQKIGRAILGQELLEEVRTRIQDTSE